MLIRRFRLFKGGNLEEKMPAGYITLLDLLPDGSTKNASLPSPSFLSLSTLKLEF